MSELQHRHYNALCAMLADMRDYQAHGEWLREAMLPILPMKEWELIGREEPVTSSKWDTDGYRWEAPDFYPYIIHGLSFWKSALLPVDAFRGKRQEEAKAIIAPIVKELDGRQAYFSLEKELTSNNYSLLIFLDKNSLLDSLFAETIGRK